MQTLMRATRGAPDSGTPLPTPFPILTQLGVHHRRGQVSVVAAASGVGKSQYASYVAVHSFPKIPTLYFSCDTDILTLAARVGAGVLQQPVSSVENSIRGQDRDVVAEVEKATDHIWFAWDNQPTCQDIKNETEAYALATGEWPHLIVVDNLINVDSEGAAGHEQKDSVMAWLQQLAGKTNSHIMVLQHVTKEFENGLTPIPKAGLLDSVAKRPRLVITLFKINELSLGFRVVKNSNGRMAADATYGVDLKVDFSRSWMDGSAIR